MSERRSVWLETAAIPQSPTLETDLDVDVAVVGGGITGLTTALLLRREGAQIALLEGATVGAGTTGNTTGKVTSQHTLVYADFIDQHGEEKARIYAEANQHAIELVSAIVSELDIDCGFERAPSFVFTQTEKERESIEAEHRAAVQLGLPATLTTETDLPLPVELALRFDGQAYFHPGRYLAGLVGEVTALGGQIFEHSRVHEVDERDDHAVVRTPAGSVRARHVVVATLLPFVDRGGFFAKARPNRAYGVAARLGSGGLEGMHISVDSPTRSTRPWVEDGRSGVIVVGETHPTGQDETGAGHWGELERWTREHFDVESFEYRWSSQDFTTADGLPYVGRSPRMEHTLVATGFRKWGLSNGTAAAVMLTDMIHGRTNPWLDTFDATRIGDAATVAKLVADNLEVGKHFVVDRFARLGAESLADLQPGEGAMAEVNGRTVGAYRSADGHLHAVSLNCSHMGCTVRWNGAEKSWDCPCHGSRFSTEGDVLAGPAVEPLERIRLDEV